MFQLQRFLTTITVLHELYSICSGNCKHQPVCRYGRQGRRLLYTLIGPAASSHRRPALGCGVQGHDEIYTLCNPNIGTTISNLPTNGAHLVIPIHCPTPALQPSIASRSDKLQVCGGFCNHRLPTADTPKQQVHQIYRYNTSTE